MTSDVLLPFLAAIVGGALRVGVPFLFVSLGECLTEKSGRINLGLEGVLVFSAMAGFGGAYLTGSPWLGVALAESPARRTSRPQRVRPKPQCITIARTMPSGSSGFTWSAACTTGESLQPPSASGSSWVACGWISGLPK